MKAKDGRAVAQQNELKILRALHRFGWLRTQDIAVLVWTQWRKRPGIPLELRVPTPSASSLRIAQRTLKRMLAKRLLLRAITSHGSRIYALATAGASALQMLGIPAVTGKSQIRSLSGSYFRHRCISNEIAISGIVQGYRVSTEREIAQGRWLGGTEGIGGKRPDVLFRSESRSVWVEVERSRKNQRDYAKMIQWLQLARRGKLRFGDLQSTENAGVGEILFICSDTFREKLIRDLRALTWTLDDVYAVVSFETSLYVVQDIYFT